MTQWLQRWTCDWRSRVQSQPLHCRVRPWANCSHKFASVPKQHNVELRPKLGSKQAHRVHGLAASAGAWLRATEPALLYGPSGSGENKSYMYYAKSMK